MTNQIIYTVTLKSLGRITQLPDSQRLFGALIHGYGKTYSDDETTELVRKISNKELDFMLSNVIPKDYLPVPQSFFNDRTTEKEIYKKIKKRGFLKKEQLTQLLEQKRNDSPKDDLLYPYVSVEDSQQIHASIDSLRYDLPWLKPNLYSVPEITVVEHESKGNRKVINEFQFFISGKNTNELGELLELLEKSKQEIEPLILGPRSSQGMNLYQIVNIEDTEKFIDFTPSNKTLYLNTGMLLPDCFDFKNSYLKLFTSERRPFRNYGERNNGTPKQIISFIESGSLIHLNEGQKIEDISQSVVSPFDLEGKQIVFGQAFLYPLIEMKEGQNE